MKHYIIIYWKPSDELLPSGRFHIFDMNKKYAVERFQLVTGIKEINVEQVYEIDG